MTPPLVIANWKMQHGLKETERILRETLAHLPAHPRAQLTVCPSFTSLQAAARVLRGSAIALGAQDLFWEQHGAYTGEVSAAMLLELGCRVVIVGHSERRAALGETDAMVRQKLLAALAAGLTPVLCVGEPAEVRQQGKGAGFVEQQLRAALTNVRTPYRDQQLAVVYEPLWAISTASNGVPCEPDEANDMREVIRAVLIDRFDALTVAASMPILYGGSVAPENITSFVTPDTFDGALVGSASLTPDGLVGLVRAFTPSVRTSKPTKRPKKSIHRRPHR